MWDLVRLKDNDDGDEGSRGEKRQDVDDRGKKKVALGADGEKRRLLRFT